MSCFTGPVEAVGTTQIFAGARPGSVEQVVVLGLTLRAPADVAVIVPVPVAQPSPVRFVDLSGCPLFFEDLESGFRSQSLLERLVWRAADAVENYAKARAEVVRSYAPELAELRRRDPRVQLPDTTWAAVPGAERAGFVVLELSARGAPDTAGRGDPGKRPLRRFSPVAFTFPRAAPDRLYFPTFQVREGSAPADAAFDHVLFGQAAAGTFGDEWVRADRATVDYLPPRRSASLVDPSLPIWRRELQGMQRNRDVWAPRPPDALRNRPRPRTIGPPLE